MPISLAQAHLVAAIGAGGKTTALGRLALAHRQRRVLLTTTTHIRPYPSTVCDRLLVNPTPQELAEALAQPGVTCAGSQAEGSKLRSLSPELLELGCQHAQLVLYEADGAKMLPLKLHRSFEPVILPHTDLCLVAAGLSAVDRPVAECVHCYQLCSDWAEHPQHTVDTSDVLFCIQDAMDAGGLSPEKYHILLTQADTPRRQQVATQLRELLTARGISCTVCPQKMPVQL